ncbi:class I mannose-6-phosphate isomerase [Aurantiacibacter rhizosphaerae]|uniref:class I mannose-6-phosphate isomerase n=1 Tax=Aurantiacibacter rhizosphaerae TaxID=2691582 RepID=UPI003B013542
MKPIHVEKVWGLDHLPAPFSAAPGKRIGEIWFEPPAELPELLVKYIFAGEKLSVQCHPNDAQAVASGHGTNGKEECWLVIDADEGAKLGVGFKEDVNRETMHSAALDGSIENLLAWHDVAPGDFFYIPANTVHAIGGGVSILEIQQNSDITYRLFDYGRPRELHLEKGMKVASGAQFDASTRRTVLPDETLTLVEGPYFRLHQVAGDPEDDLRSAYSDAVLVIPRKGTYQVDGEDIGPGDCAQAKDLEGLVFPKDGVCLVTAPCREGVSA